MIVMSAQSTLLTAVKANERGAYEYLPKPFDLTSFWLSSIGRCAMHPNPAPPYRMRQPSICR